MSFVVCPVLPFPNIYWWSFALSAPALLMDGREHFEKMSFRNRYMVAGADGVITLSIPLSEGRQQRRPMDEVRIDNKTNWQTQHWRTLKSVYNRSPYFEFYAPELEALYKAPFERLIDFNLAGINSLFKLLKLDPDRVATEQYHKNYPDSQADIRADFRSSHYISQPERYLPYHQTFEERTGFLPNLSLLDLLFAEGNRAKEYIPKY